MMQIGVRNKTQCQSENLSHLCFLEHYSMQHSIIKHGRKELPTAHWLARREPSILPEPATRNPCQNVGHLRTVDAAQVQHGGSAVQFYTPTPTAWAKFGFTTHNK